MRKASVKDILRTVWREKTFHFDNDDYVFGRNHDDRD